jgi:hypothetical protein
MGLLSTRPRFKSEVVSWNWREESNNTATLDGVTHRGLVPACCHLQFSCSRNNWFLLSSKTSQSHPRAEIFSRNNGLLPASSRTYTIPQGLHFSLLLVNYPAVLPGSIARQYCPAVLPGSLGRQSCPAVLPGSLARQSCPAGLPGSFAR